MRSAWAGLALLAVTSCAPAPPPVVSPAPPVSAPATPAPSPRPSPPETPSAPQPPRELTIGLVWDVDSLTVDPIGAGVVEGAAQGTLEERERVSIRLVPRGAQARVLGGEAIRQFAMWTADTLWVSGEEVGETAGRIRWNGKTWRGRFLVFLNPRGKLTLAVRLPLEEYLLGVVPGEIGPLDERLVEAGRAQAIAARSYSLFYRGRRSAEGFDLYATVEDQVYGPLESEKPLASHCVQSTAGEIALFQGSPIRANYCSTCGGITADVWEAWPTPPLAYLISHLDRAAGADYCASSPHHRWHEEWPVPEFLGNLRSFAPTYGVRLPAGGLGELLDVRVLARSRSGRVWTLSVVTSRGEIVIPAYSLRQVLRRPGNAAAILRSNLFKIDVRRDPRTRRARSVVASGAGSGHGVGLCQTGALGMARVGFKGEDILRHYFPGVAVTGGDGR